MEKKLTDEILKETDQLVTFIKESKEYRKYTTICQKMKNNQEIMGTIREIKELQKKVVNLEYRNQDTKKEEKKIKENLEKLNTFPIYLEYTYLQEDLNNLFQLIKEKLEQYVNEIVK